MIQSVLFRSVLILLLAFQSAAQHQHEAAKTSEAAFQLGEINFPTSGSQQAQQQFIRGVLLLHSFEYGTSRKAFAEAMRIDPGFAMAYWGAAMTHNHSIWGEQDRPAAIAVLEQLGRTPAERAAKAPTEREKGYIVAIEALYGAGTKEERDAAYSDAMGKLSEKFPEDLEAKAFYSLSLLALTGTTRNTENYMRAAGVAEEIFSVNRKHPGALHYLIHAYDDPVHAPLGLRQARLYGSVAKGASHAQHMPSHIFFALGMWEEANAANIDSMNTARNAGSGGYHPLHWLIHGYLQVGNEDAAVKLVRTIESDMQTAASRYAKSHLAMGRATYLVESARGDAAGMMDPVDSTGLTSLVEFEGHDLAMGLRALSLNDISSANVALQRLRERVASDKANLSKGSDVADRYDGISPTQVKTGEIMENVLTAAVEFASGKHEDAIKRALDAANAEDALLFEYGPPMTVKPPWEFVGELYLKMGKKEEAADAFRQALARYPNRRISNAGMKAAMK